MKEATVISSINSDRLQALALDDFSRFKEKVIMINTLKSLLSQTDKAVLKMIAKKEGEKMSAKSLKSALETIVDYAIKRVQ
jgi:hypothetical protein